MNKPENHQNCICTFLGNTEVIFQDRQFPAQEWQTPGGEKYFRVFTDPENEKTYMRCLRKDLMVIG